MSWVTFEKLSKRLKNFQMHFFWKTSNVVVSFDGMRRPSERAALDDVRVERALEQESIFCGNVFFLNDAGKLVDEETTNDSPFLFRIAYSFQLREEGSGCINALDRQRGKTLTQLCKGSDCLILPGHRQRENKGDKTGATTSPRTGPTRELFRPTRLVFYGGA